MQTALGLNYQVFHEKTYYLPQFLFPPIPEQRKIAEMLSTWDAAIAQTERLLAALRARKKGLMQRLLRVRSGLRVSMGSGERQFRKICKCEKGCISQTYFKSRFFCRTRPGLDIAFLMSLQSQPDF